MIVTFTHNKVSSTQVLLDVSHKCYHAFYAIRLYFLSLQELVRRWSLYVTDHEVYANAEQECSAWQGDIIQRLASCSSDAGDKFTIQNRLVKLQVKSH